jgi:hypothetical protein
VDHFREHNEEDGRCSVARIQQRFDGRDHGCGTPDWGLSGTERY